MLEAPIQAPDGAHVWINKENDPFFVYVDFDTRREELNMEFQHFHTFYEMMFLQDASAAHIVNGRLFNLNEGDIALLKPGILHKTVYYGNSPTRRVILAFSLPVLKGLEYSARSVLSIFDDPEHPIMRLSRETQDKISRLLTGIYDEKKHNPDYQSAYVYSKVLDLLCLLYRSRGENSYTNVQFDQMTSKIYSIICYIHERYKDPITLEDLSEKFFISSCYLSRKFKEVTGFNLVNYVQMTRVRNAQLQLYYTDNPIQLISDECGFASFSQFNRVFGKYCGESPSHFRRDSRLGKANMIDLKI